MISAESGRLEDARFCSSEHMPCPRLVRNDWHTSRSDCQRGRVQTREHWNKAMKSTLLHEHQGLRTFAVVLATGEEVVSSITSFATEHHLAATQLTAIGALSR